MSVLLMINSALMSLGGLVVGLCLMQIANRLDRIIELLDGGRDEP